MRGRTKTAVAAAALLCALASGGASAQAAGPGETFLVGGLPLPAGAIGGGESGVGISEIEQIGVSGDGRYVAFASTADAIVPGAPLDNVNIFRKDRLTGAVALVNRIDGAGGAAGVRPATRPAISDDGRRVAFVTEEALDPGDSDGSADVYVRDLGSGQTFLATAGIDVDVYDYDLSGNGLFVAFSTTVRATADDTNARSDVFRREIASGVTTLASARSGGMVVGDGQSYNPAISDDGRWVAFASEADNLIPGYVAGSAFGADVFARDLANRATHLVSRSTAGAGTGGNGGSSEPRIAGAPGAAATVTVAWSSYATDLDPADLSGASSVFRRVGLGGAQTAQLVSRAPGLGGASADSRAHTPSISDDGDEIGFSSDAGNLGAGDDYYGAYVREVSSGTTALVSFANDYAVQTTLAGDGSLVAWYDHSSRTPDGDRDLAGVHARPYATPPTPLGPPELIGRPPGSAQFLAPAVVVGGKKPGTRTVSDDGRWVVFESHSSHLPGGDGAVRPTRVYRRDLVTGAIELISRADGAGGAPIAGRAPSISADGNRVAFLTADALDGADSGTDDDAYVRDIAAGTTTWASRADGAGGVQPDEIVELPSISPDGGHVVFLTEATTLGVAGGDNHVYLRDLAQARTVLVDRADGPGGAAGDDSATSAAPSADGRFVVFDTRANNLDLADPSPDMRSDVYLRDTVAGTLRLISRRSGADGVKGSDDSYLPAISSDGALVAYQSYDETLAPEGGGWGGQTQIVARDLATQQNTLVSRAPGGAAADARSADVSIDGSGAVVAFTSAATNLLPGRGGNDAVFARRMASGELSGPPRFGGADTIPQTRATYPSLSGDGQCMAFAARGHSGANGAEGDVETLYVHVLSGSCPKSAPKGQPPVVDPPPPPRRGLVSVPLEAPRLTNASLLRARFRVGRDATAVTAAARRAGGRSRGRGRARGRRATPAGTAFRFRLNARANLTIAIERPSSGRKVGSACRRATPRLRRRRACTRWAPVATLRRGGLDGGRRSLAFSGRIGRRALAPGRYRATLKAGNASGASKPVTLAFTIVRR